MDSITRARLRLALYAMVMGASGLGALVVACSSFSGGDLPSSSSSSSGGNDGAPADSTPGNPPSDAASAGTDSGAGDMIDAGPFAIDRHEVTNAQYNQFLGALLGADASAYQTSLCTWKDSWSRKCTASSAAPDDPVSCVDWCDAWTYCKWAGKRLCGKVGGGGTVNPDNDRLDPLKSEWMLACSGVEDQPYPYGSEADPDRCQTSENADKRDGGRGPVAVGSRAGCQGRLAGLFDMSGNVSEWEDNCDLNGALPANSCVVRGGSFETSAANATCRYLVGFKRNESSDKIGFRCCAGP